MQRWVDGLKQGFGKIAQVRECIPERRSGLLSWYFMYAGYLYKANKKPVGDVNIIISEASAYLLLVLPSNKTVVICHDLNPLFAPSVSLLTRMRYRFSLLFLKKAYKIIAISNFTRNILLENIRGLDAGKVVVVNNGLEPIFKPILIDDRLQQIKAKYGVGLNKKVVLHVGNDNWYKNFKTLLNVFDKIENKDILLFKVGALSTENQAMAERLREKEQFAQVMDIDDDMLVGVYSIASVLVYPSVSEGFGWPVIEAMACGCPVIAANSGSLPEIVSDAAILVEPYDVDAIKTAIERMLYDNELREDYIKKGIKNIKRYSWEKTASEILNTVIT